MTAELVAHVLFSYGKQCKSRFTCVGSPDCEGQNNYARRNEEYGFSMPNIRFSIGNGCLEPTTSTRVMLFSFPSSFGSVWLTSLLPFFLSSMLVSVAFTCFLP